MSLTKDNLDTISKLLTALSQRNNVILELARTLASDTVWRSPDGRLEVKLTEAQREETEGFVRAYAQESELVISAIKAHLGAKE